MKVFVLASWFYMVLLYTEKRLQDAQDSHEAEKEEVIVKKDLVPWC